MTSKLKFMTIIISMIYNVFLFQVQAFGQKPYQWRGIGSKYSGTPPFLLIKDMYDLTAFWKRHSDLSEMPFVDFSTSMVFIFCPGNTRFEYNSMEVVSFTQESEKDFLILVNLERSKTGGYLKSPYLIAILPKVEGKNIYVGRIGNPSKGEPKRVPLYCFGEYGGYKVTKFNFNEKTSPKVEFITASLPKETTTDTVGQNTLAQTSSTKKSLSSEATSNSNILQATTNRVSSRPVITEKSPSATNIGAINSSNTAKTQNVKSKVSSKNDNSFSAFGESESLGFEKAARVKNKEQPTTEKKESSTSSKSSGKDILTDPFEEEFNIEF